MTRLRAFTAIAAAFALAQGIVGAPAQAESGVSAVADIAPVHSLLAAVMGAGAEPRMLVRPGASPHGYAMKPSEAGALAEADLVVWLGPEAQPWLESSIAALAPSARSLSLADLPGVTRLTRQDALAEPHRAAAGEGARDDHADGDSDGHGDDHGDGHAHGGDGVLDPHLWLDPENARIWLAAIAEALGQLDPDNAAQYRANAEQAQAEIAALSEEMQARLAPVRGRAYLALHDAYGYFENRFGPSALAAVMIHDELKPSVARVMAVKALMAEHGVRCIVSQPQVGRSVVTALGEDDAVRVVEIDPLGARIPPGPGLYLAMLRAVGEGMESCLKD